MRMISIFRFALVCCVLGLAPAGAVAQAGKPDGTIGFAVVNVQKILREAAATKTIRPQIEKLKSNYQDKFKKYEEDLRTANQELQRQRSIISPEAYADRLKGFKERVNRRQREVQSVQRMLDKAGSDALGKVHRQFQQITLDLAKERSLQFIIPRSNLLYVDPRYDISDEVLKRLNKELPSVTVVLPENMPDADAGALPDKN